MIDTTHDRAIIADDHPLFRGALREVVAGLFAHARGDAGSFDDVAGLLERGGQLGRVLLDLLNKETTYELCVLEAVKAHVSAMLQKLGVESRMQAVIAAAKIELGQWSHAINAGGY